MNYEAIAEENSKTLQLNLDNSVVKYLIEEPSETDETVQVATNASHLFVNNEKSTSTSDLHRQTTSVSSPHSKSKANKDNIRVNGVHTCDYCGKCLRIIRTW